MCDCNKYKDKIKELQKEIYNLTQVIVSKNETIEELEEELEEIGY